MQPFDLAPEPDADGLTTLIDGVDATGQPVSLPVVAERALTIFLNGQEIVTAMSLGDHVKELAVGFLYNQNMLQPDDVITDVDIDLDINVVVVRTEKQTNYEDKLAKKTRTSGCAQGTVFGDIMDRFEQVKLNPDVRLGVKQLMTLSKIINTTPSLYLKAGAIHGCVLCNADRPLIYVEDIGRHNAVDKIAGHMFLKQISGHDKLFYTTGRLTSEMVIKTVLMNIPILISRSGFTEAGVALAREAGLTLIGRAKGSRFIALSGVERIVFDADTDQVSDPSSELHSAQRRMQE